MYRWNDTSRRRPHRRTGSTWGSANAKRATDRIPFSGSVVLVCEGERIRTSAGNISVGGAFVRTDRPPSVGEMVTLLIEIDSALSLHVSGIVRWQELDTELNPIGCGLEFTNISEALRDSIQDLVSTSRERADDAAAATFFAEMKLEGTGTNG